MNKLLFLFSFFFLFIHIRCTSENPRDKKTPKREFRAFWVVTLDNKDFPSQPGLSTKAQKEELIRMLDYHQKKGMNAVIFQVRPSADAFYQSSFEPWSEWLTGKQGRSPRPFYDPLAFLIEECHQRNMELHAWFNPYRAVFNVKVSDVSYNHVVHKHPEWFITYDNKKQFNPGLPVVREYILSVVMDVVKRYDVDGIQFDDYFYPYKMGNKDFPDDRTFLRYKQYFKNKGNWRRHNVDLLIKTLHDSIQQAKPRVKFGISPMGVWRNKTQDKRGSATFVGQTSYDYLGADVLKWLEKGWIDYIAPQVYWSIGHRYADYKTLAYWWAKNTQGRHLYMGQAFYKIDNDSDKKWNNPSEMPNQLRMNRSLDNISGSIFFRAKFLMKNANHISDTLAQNFYKYPSLIPPMPWKDSIPPLRPEKFWQIRTKKRVILKWKPPQKASDGETATYYVLYRFKEDEKIHLQQTKNIISIQRHTDYTEKIKKGEKYTYLLTAVDRLHNESPYRYVEVE